ncbi:MAG: N-acetyltransferase [Rhodobacteraceae bacterium]|nr:MAG: N-acetyltransferase [Paracoccaceae bacterium]
MKLDQIVNQQVIETERFTLRPMRRSDTGLIGMYASDKRVAWHTTTIPHPLPPGTTEAFVERAMSPERTEDVWVIDGTVQDTGEVLGTIGLKRMDRAQSEIGYWVAPAFWNSGLASEAVRAIVDANPRDDDTMFGVVFQDNPASARVLTNAGFEYIGDAEAFSVARNATVATWTYIRNMG